MIELKVRHKSTTIDIVWVEVNADSKEEAIKLIMAGNYDWLDSSPLDTIDGEFIDVDEWEVTREPKEYIDHADEDEEHY